MLTVLFATKNRAKLLARVLESFSQLKVPEGGWRLVVADNGSTDDTVAVLNSFRRSLPLEFLIEKTPGKNSALNAGLVLVEGDLTVLTDDDVFPQANWLIELRRAADEHSEFTMFAGTIAPKWERIPPRWTNWIDLGPVFTLTDPGLKEGETRPFLVFGPNMAIRSKIFESGIRFNPEIGPRGSNYAMGSESELTTRLGDLGHKAFFVPEAVVGHYIRQEQLSTVWVMKRAFRYGRGFFRLFRMGELDQRRMSRRMGIPEILIQETREACFALREAVLTFEWEVIFRACYQVNFLRGQIVEARKIIREEGVNPGQPAASHAGEQ
jgi:L-malate glycosyltransferase